MKCKKLKILHLNLKGEYFDDIKDGIKPFEFRKRNDYWLKRLVGKDYDEVHLKRGYPKSDDTDKIIKCVYIGFEIQTITHKHFNGLPTSVYAIHTTGGKAWE